MWAAGGCGRGYAMLNDDTIRRDPLLRLFLRDDQLERGRRGGGKRVTRDGVTVSLDAGNMRDLTEKGEKGEKGALASRELLEEVLLPLHAKERFTRGAFTDGSVADPRREGKKGEKKRVAYGVYEGPWAEGEVEASMAWVQRSRWRWKGQAEREEECVTRGM